MYRLLGNRSAQEEIRAVEPGNHCWRLIEDPMACQECKYNPYSGPSGDLYRAIDRANENNPDILEEAFRLRTAVSAGMIGDDLTTDELEILTVLQRDRPILETHMLLDGIARIVSQIFGSKEE